MLALALAAAFAAPPVPFPGRDVELLDGAPIHYEAPATAGPVERVAAALESGALELPYDEATGYLPALLQALDVPVSSQVLVFSKTSFQNDLISPRSPRSVYFGDGAYVGSIPGAPIIELTSFDPERGPVFYALEQTTERPARITRRDAECLQCHASSRTRDWPGNLVRSVHPDTNGQPILRSGTSLVTHETPFEERWGGWYVTGTHGDARHRGNTTADPETERVDVERGANVTDLSPYFRTDAYLSPHSDLVALLVLEHQAELHNRIARASYETRLALHRQEESNRLFGDPPGTRRESTDRILASHAKKLVEYVLFEKEAPLPAPVRGTSGFAAEFEARGRRDEGGRSLRDLDLETRLFRYPCSYLVHSEAFDALPAELLEVVYRELWRALSEAAAKSEPHRAALAILRATKADLPAYWNG